MRTCDTLTRMNALLPTPQGVIDAAWNLCRHGPNYDGRIKDVEAAARTYASRIRNAALDEVVVLIESRMREAESISGPEAAGWLEQVAESIKNLKTS